jgi:LysM repeat protein
MNNSNPLIPQGSLLEQQNKGRARVKVAVLCVLGLHVLFFGGLLMLGCKKEQAAPPVDGTTAGPDTSLPPVETTNATPQLPVPPGPGNTTTAQTPPPSAPEPPVNAPPTVVAPATSDYVVVKGDTYYTIGKKLGVSMKAMENANPSVPPTKLKPGQKLVVPAGTTAPVVNNTSLPGGTAMLSAPDAVSTYVVKSGDSLTKVAKDHGVTVKALRAANDLKTDKIKVGQKLKLPARTSAPAPEPAPLSAPTVPPAAYTPPSVSAPAATVR